MTVAIAKYCLEVAFGHQLGRLLVNTSGIIIAAIQIANQTYENWRKS
jgi:uncharacterized ion transporter superfamily protein YfcC